MSQNNSHIEDDISFEERDKIWNLIYKKISKAVDKKQNFAILFSTTGSENKEEGYSAIISDDQYEILLQNFLMWSEEQERYEICIEVNKTIKKLELWKKKN